MRTRFIVITIIALLVGTSIMSAQTTPDDYCSRKGGVLIPGELKCALDTGIKISIDYPAELAAYPVADQVVSQWLEDTRQNFYDSYSYIPEVGAFANSWTLDANYQWFNHASDTFSMLFSVETYVGGSRPDTYFHSFTFNTADQRQLTLADVFLNGQIPWTDISNLVLEDLKTTLGSEAPNVLLIDAATPVNPDNYQNWVVTDDSLIFYFSPYQVTTYDAGPQQVEIPFVALHSLLAPQFEGL